jgi:hypothetical protein
MSAAGFSVAYFFDPQNGAARRRRLHERVRQAGVAVDQVMSPESMPEQPAPRVTDPSRRPLPFASPAGAGSRHH